MEKKQFTITINAPREKIWNILWNDATFPQWTSVFSEGSHAKSDWKKGSKVLFIDGKGDGVASTIVENIPNECMIFRNEGTVKNGKEDQEFNSELHSDWAGSMEAWTLHDSHGKTEISLDIDIVDEHMEYFTETVPKALQKLKEIAEKKKEKVEMH
jgi:uncharacterized protein YndB with AHSA1/START domain